MIGKTFASVSGRNRYVHELRIESFCIVYDTEKYDRITEPCNTVPYDRKGSVFRM